MKAKIVFLFNVLLISNLMSQPESTPSGQYARETFTAGMTPLTGGTVIWNGAGGTYDDTYADVPVGFDFYFYPLEDPDPNTMIRVSTNGFISFFQQGGGATNGVNPTNYPIANPLNPDGFAAPWWDDLIVGTYEIYTSVVKYKTEGIAGERILTVEWKDVFRKGGTSLHQTHNFQVKLCEGSNIIEFHYGNWNADATDNATVGMENFAGTDGDCGPDCSNSINWEPPAENYRFIPVSPGTWVGNVSQDWHTPGNWLGNAVPAAITNVVIPAGCPNYPEITGSDANCRELAVEYGASLNINGKQLHVGRDASITGHLSMLYTNPKLWTGGSIVWGAGSTISASPTSKIYVASDWTFSQGNNVVMDKGTVEFYGSAPSAIFCHEENCSLNNLLCNKTSGDVTLSGNLPEAFTINGNLITNAGNAFVSNSLQEINIGGRIINNGNFMFNSGTVVFNGDPSGDMVDVHAGDCFNNLTVDCSTFLSFNSTASSDSVVINGNVLIKNGTLGSMYCDFYVHGNWANNVGPTGFYNGNRKVNFIGFGGQQTISGSTNFSGLEQHPGAGGFMLFYDENEVQDELTIATICQLAPDSYLDVSGTLDLSSPAAIYRTFGKTDIAMLKQGGTFTVQNDTSTIADLDETNLSGTYIVVDGELNIFNDDSYLDMEAQIDISGGTMNLESPHVIMMATANPGCNTSITMSGGTIDLICPGVVLHSAALNFSENISGGTIRTTGYLNVQNMNFTPSGGVVSLYGSSSAWIKAENGSCFYNLLIENSADSVFLYSDIIVQNDLTINGNGVFSVGPLNCSIEIMGDWINNSGEAFFDEGMAEVLFYGPDPAGILSDETFYNLSIEKSCSGFGFEISEDIAVLNDCVIMDGAAYFSGANLSVGNDLVITPGSGLSCATAGMHNISMYGNWINDNTSNTMYTGFYPGNSYVTFKGTGDQYLYTYAPAEIFYALRVDKPDNEFWPQDNLIVDYLRIKEGYLVNTAVLSLDITITGDLLVNSAGYLHCLGGNLVFAGGHDQQYENEGDVFLTNVIVDKDDPADEIELISDCFIDGSLVVSNGTVIIKESTTGFSHNIIIQDGGTLSLCENGRIEIGPNGGEINVNNGGTLLLAGSPGNEAIVTHPQLSVDYYGLYINNGGTVGAEHAIFEYMNSDGVWVKPGGYVDPAKSFNHCTFRNGDNSGISQLLLVNNGQTLAIDGASFPVVPGGAQSFNVSKLQDMGEISFTNVSGDFAGETYEYDPFGRIHWPAAGFSLELKAFLEGPFNGSDMNTTLNSGGHLPLAQPYNQPPWSYNGTESVAAIPNADVVDWILVELRDASDAVSATSATVVAQQAAFLLKNGATVSIDGSSLPLFTYSPVNSLFAVLWHRNSIGIMSSVPLIENGGIYTYDFTTSSNMVYGGSNAHKELAPGIWGMIGADGNADGQVNNGDKNDVWSLQAGTGGYLEGDFNLDAQVNNGDKNDVWVPNTGLGGQVPN